MSAHDFHQRVITDAGAAVRGLTVALGERLGLYKALAEQGPLTAGQLAETTGTNERYIEEWLHAQLSAGYVERHPSSLTYTLPADHVEVLADPKAVTYAAGFFTALKALYATEDLLVEAYRTVADVGCGVGHTTLLIAKAFPQATVHGFDYSEEAISIARELAEEAGLSDRVVFEVASADDYPGSGYDLVCFFNALHDMGDPVAAAQHVHKSLDADGTWMLVESNVSPQDIDTQTPAARMFMALSAVMCLPVAVAQRGPHALGNHSGEKAFRGIAEEAGFTRWRRATETAVNAVYEVRP